MSKGPCIAIVGATGAVGREILTVLSQRDFPLGNLRLLASHRSMGTVISWRGTTYTVEKLGEESFDGVDIVFFSAGASISQRYAPIAVSRGCLVVDNSSAFRMNIDTPLVVPEVNAHALVDHSRLIAVPNCSTILLCVAIWPLHQRAKIKRILVSTYQAASGAGAIAMAELAQQARDWVAEEPITKQFFGRQYIFNVFCHESKMDQSSGYNNEELKMAEETRKIFGNECLEIAATCVRVPVLRAHSQAVYLTFENPISVEESRSILKRAPGVEVLDDREKNQHPEPILASHEDPVLVGRIRQDLSRSDGQGLALFLAGDQLRKGAALNAVQIAEAVLKG